MHNLSEQELVKVRLSRRALEVDVAKSIGKYLISNHKRDIKELVLAMIDRIFELQYAFDQHFDVHRFLRKQTKFVMWKLCNTSPALTLIALQRVRKYIAMYLPEGYAWLNVCSDVIRLFGEISEEKVVKNLRHTNWDIMAKKNDLRPNPVFLKRPKKGNETDQEYEKRAEEMGVHRDRGFKTGNELRRIEAPFIPIADRDRVEWRGIEMFKFEIHSVIETIDWAYGLQIEGGDVSGTTTDSIAALRWAYASTRLINPIAQLMAIATLVPQGHHSIVECAWPLTRHGYMNYKIGFYETLVPAAQGYDDLRASLEHWNNDVRNKHVLVCKDMTRRLKLNFHFEKPDEISEYKKIAGVRDAYSFCVGGHPNINTTENMMRAHGMNNLVVSRMR